MELTQNQQAPGYPAGKFLHSGFSPLSLLATLLLVVSCSASSANVENHSYFSKVLEREITYLVYLPQNYAEKKVQGKRYPVLYLLHCAGGISSDWHQVSKITAFIDSVGFIAVAPDDGFGLSWWVDSPKKPKDRFSTFLAEEFKGRVDSLYATLPGPENSGLAGFSMGGFGSLYNLMTHPDKFSIAYGICAGTDILRWPGNWGLDAVLGSQVDSRENWEKVNILTNVEKFKGNNFKIRFYSADGDFFLDENRRLDTLLDSLGVPHDYFEYKGFHNYPDSGRMMEILQFFDTTFAFNGASGLQTGRLSENGLKNTGLFLSVMLSNSEMGDFRGIYNLLGKRKKRIPFKTAVLATKPD